MARELHVNEDLRGITIRDPGPFLYVGGCTLGERSGVLTTFIGDCTAADFINNTGPADWLQADTYAGYWRGNTNMKGSLWPVGIGYLHHEPVADILRQGIAKATGIERAILAGLPAWVVADYSFHSWSTGWSEYASKIRGATPESFISALTLAVEGYLSLEGRVASLGRELLGGTLKPMLPEPSARDAEFFDGVKVRVDASNLPPLARPSDRYELARKVEADADALSATSHYAFTHSIVPPLVTPLRAPDGWLQRKAGF